MFRRCSRWLPKRQTHTWIKPEGYDTGIKVFNCTTRTKDPLIVRNKNLVTWYTCGPTVYDSAHVGHASCYVKLDIIQKILKEHFRLNLITVMNITDIDDKIISRSKLLKVPVEQLTRGYEQEFFADLAALQIKKSDCIIRVTENIDVIVRFIQELVNNGMAYSGKDGSVYFDVGRYGNYGKLQNIGEDSLTEEGTTLKKNRADFALWKAAKREETCWESPWGPGRPGWHIECSALASYVLGSTIDIHAGGIDLRFPHHENEEAQSCAYHSQTQWVNYWFHTGHLHQQDAVKMSKSLKNTITIRALLETTPSDVFRMACAMTHYRSAMLFTPEFMSTATDLVRNYKNFFDSCDTYAKGYVKSNIDELEIATALANAAEEINDALADDFNTPKVIKTLNNVVSRVNSMVHCSGDTGGVYRSGFVMAASNFVNSTLNLFGIVLDRATRGQEVDQKFVEVMNIMNDFRQNVRQLGITNKDQAILKLCDGARDNLKLHGIAIKDRGKISSWST